MRIAHRYAVATIGALAVATTLIVTGCSNQSGGSKPRGADSPPTSAPRVVHTIELGERGKLGDNVIAFDAERRVLYVANRSPNTSTASVLVVDVATKKVIKTFVTSHESPMSIAIDQQLDTLYVSTIGGGGPDDSSVDVIDLNAGTVKEPITPGGTIVVDPITHALYVGASVYDGKTRAQTGTVPVKQFNLPMAIDPSNKRLYVGRGLPTSSVDVIDTTDNQMLTSVPLEGPQYVSDVKVDPSTHTLYAADRYKGVQVIDGAANAWVKTIAVKNDALTGLAVDPGRFVYAVSGGAENPGRVEVIDVGSGTFNASIDIGREPSAVAVDPDTHDAYVLGHDGRDVTVSVIAAM